MSRFTIVSEHVLRLSTLRKIPSDAFIELYDVTSRKTVILTFTAVRTSGL
jgi:hypothetical protein